MLRKTLIIFSRGIILWLLLFVVTPLLRGQFVFTGKTVLAAFVCFAITAFYAFYKAKKQDRQGV